MVTYTSPSPFFTPIATPAYAPAAAFSSAATYPPPFSGAYNNPAYPYDAAVPAPEPGFSTTWPNWPPPPPAPNPTPILTTTPVYTDASTAAAYPPADYAPTTSFSPCHHDFPFVYSAPPTYPDPAYGPSAFPSTPASIPSTNFASFPAPACGFPTFPESYGSSACSYFESAGPTSEATPIQANFEPIWPPPASDPSFTTLYTAPTTPNREFYSTPAAAPQIDAYQTPSSPYGYSTFPYAAPCCCPTCLATQIPTHVDQNQLPPAPMDSNTGIGYQDHPALSAFTVAEHATHEVCNQRSVPGYTHQVFGEMPTPNTGYETHVISSGFETCGYGYSNQIPSPCVQEGTERHYYALPDDCLTKSEQKSNFGTVQQSICDMLAQIQAQLQTMLKRCETKQPVEANTAGPAPVLCSKSNNTTDSESLVHDLQPPTAVVQDNPNGLKEMLVSDVSQDGKQETEQLLQRCSKAPETTQTTTCLTYISDVQDFTLELQQNDEKTSVNVQQLRAPPWNLLVTHERRKAWDPGEHTILSSTPTRRIVGFHEASILSRISIFKLNDVLVVRTTFGVTNCCVPQQCYCSVPSSKENHRVLFLWDPGILRQSTFSLQQQDDDRAGDYSVLKGSYSFATRSNQLITEHIKRQLRLLWDPGASSYLQSMGSSDTAAMLCCPPGILILQRRNSAALLHFSKYIILGSVVCLWDPGASAYLQSSMDSATVTL